MGQLRDQAAAALRRERDARAWARENMDSRDELRWEAVWIAVRRAAVAMELLQAAAAIEKGPPKDLDRLLADAYVERLLAEAYVLADAPLDAAEQLIAA